MRRVWLQLGLVVVVGFGVLIGTRLVAQERTQGEGEAGPTAKVRATTVLVDVVVRDKKGRPIHDLQPSDFEVYEDGVRQEVSHFEEIGGSTPGAEKVAEASSSASKSAPEGQFTAMVFDRLSPNSRSFALKAAKAYISDAPFPDSKIGIFFADLTPRTLQFYTDSKQSLESVIDQALGGTSTRQGSVTADASSGTAGARPSSDAGDLTAPAAPGASNASAPGAVVQGQAAVDAGTIAMSERMSSMAGRLQQDEQGYASINTLLAIVSSLEPLPGRKSILYFSEGMSIPPAVEARFRSVISLANRANVSIYTVDAAGLRVESTGVGSAAQINSAADRGGANSTSLFNGNDSLLRGGLETNETAIKSDTHSALNRLASETGGLLIRETNRLEDGMQEIAQDLSDYYLLGYVPKNPEMDGTYREIDVKVDAKDARPRFRDGYFAIDRSITEPVLDYEAPVIALMDKPDVEGPLTIHSAALSFPEKATPGLVSVLAEIPPGSIAYSEGDENAPSTSDFCFVVLFRDRSGDVVRKVSQRYRLRRAEGQTPNDGILFYKQLELEPGEYSVQVAGYDAVAKKIGFSRNQLAVPVADPANPRLSSVLIVRAAEALSGQGQGGAQPLQYQGVQLYPNLGEPMSKAKYTQITFYFSVFPGTQKVEAAKIDLLSGERVLHSFRVPLPAPDAQGRVQFASAIPSQSIPAGDYALKVTVGSGDSSTSRTCEFKLAE